MLMLLAMAPGPQPGAAKTGHCFIYMVSCMPADDYGKLRAFRLNHNLHTERTLLC